MDVWLIQRLRVQIFPFCKKFEEINCIFFLESAHSSSSKTESRAMTRGTYDEIYFDSDEDAQGYLKLLKFVLFANNNDVVVGLPLLFLGMEVWRVDVVFLSVLFML